MKEYLEVRIKLNKECLVNTKDETEIFKIKSIIKELKEALNFFIENNYTNS